MDLRSRQVLAGKREIIEVKSRELQRVEPFDHEVIEFQKEKSVLQRQIDLINVLKQQQKTVWRGVQAVAKLGDEAALVRVFAVPVDLGKPQVVLTGRAVSDEAVNVLAQKLGAQKTSKKAAFTLQVKE